MTNALDDLIDIELVIHVIAKQLHVEPSEVSLDTRFVTDLGADDVALTDLYLALEEAFEVSLAPDECATLMTLGAVLRCLDGKWGER